MSGGSRVTTTARHIMRGPALSVGPGTGLAELQRILVENRIHGVPVVDPEGRVLGIVSSSDLLAQGLPPDDAKRFRPAAIDYLAQILEYSVEEAAELTMALDDSFGDRTVAEVMTADAVTVDVDAPVAEVAAALVKHQIHRVVVTEHGRIAGIVSSLDLVAVLAHGG
jgi:CBS domain-containing protein